MEFLLYTIFGIIILYAIYMLFFVVGLFHLKRQPSVFSTLEPSVSVIIAARNEEKNIGNLLDALTKQTYPISKFEAVVANDRS